VTPQPGDFFVVNTGTRMSLPITAAEWLDDKVSKSKYKWTDYDHAGLCTASGTSGIRIVEATPGGAVEVNWHYAGRPHLWSSGHIDLDMARRDAIASQALWLVKEKVGYGWLDYEALTLHAFGVKAQWLQDYIGDTRRLICSQLVDLCYEYGTVHLFDDKRWPGYVKPSDLGALLA